MPADIILDEVSRSIVTNLKLRLRPAGKRCNSLLFTSVKNDVAFVAYGEKNRDPVSFA